MRVDMGGSRKQFLAIAEREGITPEKLFIKMLDHYARGVRRPATYPRSLATAGIARPRGRR